MARVEPLPGNATERRIAGPGEVCVHGYDGQTDVSVSLVKILKKFREKWVSKVIRQVSQNFSLALVRSSAHAGSTTLDCILSFHSTLFFTIQRYTFRSAI